MVENWLKIWEKFKNVFLYFFQYFLFNEKKNEKKIINVYYEKNIYFFLYFYGFISVAILYKICNIIILSLFIC